MTPSPAVPAAGARPAPGSLGPRWVLAAPGPGPLRERAVAWSQSLLDAVVPVASTAGENFELVAVDGPDAALFPVDGEGPRYWESLNPGHEFVGLVSDHVEAYLFAGTVFVVDDSGPGSPELLGTLDARLGPRPPDPDDLGVDEDDPRWRELSDAELAWMNAVERTGFAHDLARMGAVQGWALVSELASGGYDPSSSGDLALWIADRLGRLTSDEAPASEPPPSSVEVPNAELTAGHVIVGESGGRCALFSDARASAFGEDLVSVETEHGMLLLDPDSSSAVEA